jgi:Pyruvate/2-oxoglutarate dehydrogenase complex, dihydrolipoamide acyltransferase (E2) component, and related enzymes
MPKEFHLPEIAESVVEGEISKWLVKEGDEVEKEQPLVEVITDKVTVEIPSPFKGKILKILAKEGDVVRVHQPILVYAEEGEVDGYVEIVEKKAEERIERVEDLRGKTVKRSERVLAAPAVRKLVRSLGIDLSLVKGTVRR